MDANAVHPGIVPAGRCFDIEAASFMYGRRTFHTVGRTEAFAKSGELDATGFLGKEGIQDHPVTHYMVFFGMTLI